MKFFLVLVLLFIGFNPAIAQNEQSPILEKQIEYKNWSYKTVRDNKEINLRDSVKGKKLVLVVYFAPWCHNWKHEAPFVQKMYEKYKSLGFEVIGVSEYGTTDELKSNIDFFKLTFPITIESTKYEDREKTKHFQYRKAAGDTRKWGSPWNIFLEPANLSKDGDILVNRAFISQGELIEAEAEKFIRQKLGLSEQAVNTESAKKDLEACAGDKKTIKFKKP